MRVCSRRPNKGVWNSQTTVPDTFLRPSGTDSYLKTITAALRRRDHGVELPKAMIRRILANAHSWAGGEFAREGDYRSARVHLARSLTYRPWQPRVLAELALCCLPGGLGNALRGAVRGLKACWSAPRPA